MATERKPFLLRIDPRLFDALQRWARDDLRSVNAQIDWLLRQALAKAGRAQLEANAPEPEHPPSQGAPGAAPAD